MKKTLGFLVAASIVLAMAFTLSCSDDDSGGGYISCSEAWESRGICTDKYEAEYDACNNSECKEKVEGKMYKCVYDKICGGNSLKECEAYYEDKCMATIEEELPPPPPEPSEDINWNNESSGTLEITNGSNKDMVLFVGQTPSERNLLGGIRAGATRLFDVSDDVSDFSTGGYMVLRGISKAQYLENIDNLSQAKIDVSTMATYKAGQKYRLNINPSYVGDYGFIVDNNSPIGIELRKDSPRGEKVAYLPALASNQKIYASSADALNLFPVYVYYNTSTAEVTTITSTDLYQTIEATPRPLTNATSMQTYAVPVSKSAWNDIIGSLTVPNGYITVTNNTNNAAFFTIGGGNALMSQSGYDALGTGESLSYEIEGNDEILEDQFDEDGKKIGTISRGGGREITFVITAYNGIIMVPVTDPTDPDGAVKIMNAYDYSISVSQLPNTDGRNSTDYTAIIEKGKKRDLSDMITKTNRHTDLDVGKF